MSTPADDKRPASTPASPEVGANGGHSRGVTHVPRTLPLLTLRGRVPVPGQIESVVLIEAEAENAVRAGHDDLGFVVAVWSPLGSGNWHSQDDETIPDIGMMCRVLTLSTLNARGSRVDLEGVARVRVLDLKSEGETTMAQVTEAVTPEVDLSEAEAHMGECQSVLKSFVEESGEYSRDLLRAQEITSGDPSRYADFVASSLHLRLDQHWALVQTLDPLARLELLTTGLAEKIVHADLFC